MQSGFTGDLVRVSPDVLFVQYFSRKTRDSTKFAFHHDQLGASFSIPFVTRNICLLAPSHFTCVNPYVTSKPATHEKVVSGSAKEFTHRDQCGAVKRRRRMPRSVCNQSAGVGRGWMKRGSFVSFKPPCPVLAQALRLHPERGNEQSSQCTHIQSSTSRRGGLACFLGWPGGVETKLQSWQFRCPSPVQSLRDELFGKKHKW